MNRSLILCAAKSHFCCLGGRQWWGQTGGSRGIGDKCIDSGSVLKVKPQDLLWLGCGVLGPDNSEDGAAVDSFRKTAAGRVLGGRSGFGFGLGELEMSVRHVTQPLHSLAVLSVQCEGSFLPCLCVKVVEVDAWVGLLKPFPEDSSPKPACEILLPLRCSRHF